MSRKDKQSIKRRQRESAQALNNVMDIGDIGEFEELAELSNQFHEQNEDSNVKSKSLKTLRQNNDSENGTTSALQLAVNAFVNSSAKGGSGDKHRKLLINDDVEDIFADTSAKQKKIKPKSESVRQSHDDFSDGDDSGNEEEDYESNGYGVENEFDNVLAAGDREGSKKRRRAPEMDHDKDDSDRLLEAFSSRKKDFVQKKKEFYTAAPRFGGREEIVQENQKRGVSYEIVANKGLMPHRKKANRNPRVKKREAYAKAIVARKGQVRDVISGAGGAYGGELTGIKANVARSRKLTT